MLLTGLLAGVELGLNRVLQMDSTALPRLARERGARVIDVNPEPGPIAEIADCPLRGPSGVILPRILTALWAGSADA